MSGPALWMTQSICRDCVHKREITSGTGSQFWLCQMAIADERFHKYPPQPVGSCAGYQAVDAAKHAADT